MSHFDSISNQYSSARSLIYIFFRHPRKSKVQNYSVTDRNTIKTNFRTFQVTNNINQSREIHNLWNDKASKTTSVCTKGKSTAWAHAKPNSSGIQCLKTKLKKERSVEYKNIYKMLHISSSSWVRKKRKWSKHCNKFNSASGISMCVLLEDQ